MKNNQIPDISVIIPLYNGEKYITTCLAKLLHNKDVNIEIIVINDGSNDKGCEIVQKYCNEYPNVFLFHEENKGQGAARNLGIKLAHGNYIAFCDQDDYYSGIAFSKMYQRAKSTHAEIIFCDTMMIDVNNIVVGYGRVASEVYISDNKKELGLESMFSLAPWAKIIKRTLFVDNNIWFIEGVKTAEDIGTMPFVISKAKSYSIINLPLYINVKHTSSTNGEIFSKYDERMFSILDSCFKVLVTHKSHLEDEYYETLLHGMQKHYFEVIPLLLMDPNYSRKKKNFELWVKKIYEIDPSWEKRRIVQKALSSGNDMLGFINPRILVKSLKTQNYHKLLLLSHFRIFIQRYYKQKIIHNTVKQERRANRKSLIFVINDFKTGGVESAFIAFSNRLIEFYDITLLVSTIDGDFINKLDSGIRLIVRESRIFSSDFYKRKFSEVMRDSSVSKISKLKRMVCVFYRRSQLFRKVFNCIIGNRENENIEKYYDIAIAYHWDNVSSKICLEDIKANRKFQWVHGDVSSDAQLKELELPVLAQNHSQFDKIIFVDESIKQSYEQLFPFLSTKCMVLLNCIENFEIINKAIVPDRITEFANKKNIILTVARLEPQKAIARAIEVARRMVQDSFLFNWFFIGDGTEREIIQKLIDKHDLNHCCYLLGTKFNPYKYMFQADIFVLPSLFEGRGLVVEEAKILEKPILITNFKSAESIIKHKTNGLICENNIESIVESLELLLRDNKLKSVLSQNLRGFLFDNKYTIKAFKELVESTVFH